MIPAMTDPLGKYWKQPPVGQIEIDETHAMMSRATFAQLPEYSTTMPSGVYSGKMWSANFGGTLYLRWYGVSDNPEFCSNNEREVLLT